MRELIEWIKETGIWGFASLELVVIVFLSWRLWKDRNGFSKVCGLIETLNKKIGGIWHSAQNISKQISDLQKDINDMEKKNIEFATELKQVIKMVDIVATKVIEIVSSFRTFMDSLK